MFIVEILKTQVSKEKIRTFRHPNLAIQKLLLLTFLIPISIALIILTCTHAHTHTHTHREAAQADEHGVPPLSSSGGRENWGGAKYLEARGQLENEEVSMTADMASGSQPAPAP